MLLRVWPGMLSRKNGTKSPHGHLKFKDEGTPKPRLLSRWRCSERESAFSIWVRFPEETPLIPIAGKCTFSAALLSAWHLPGQGPRWSSRSSVLSSSSCSKWEMRLGLPTWHPAHGERHILREDRAEDHPLQYSGVSVLVCNVLRMDKSDLGAAKWCCHISKEHSERLS